MDPSATAAQIRKACPVLPKLAIVLGSGFAGVASSIQISVHMPYSKLPGFTTPTTAGHPGELLVGKLGDVPALFLNGRTHFYEGCSLAEVTFPVRVLAKLGMTDLLLTNAAGAINPQFSPGEFMLVTDHINMLPENPLRGVRGTTKFLDMTQTYDPLLQKLLRRAARLARVSLRSGVYIAVSGPNYETPAEIRAFATLGADAVGMSTVPEAIVARSCGMRVAAVSCLTNFAAGRSKGLLSHAEVLITGEKAKAAAAKLLKAFATEYAQSE